MSDQQYARDRLKGLGIQKPSPQLVENWIRANRDADTEQGVPAELPPAQPPAQVKPENFRPKHPRGYSKSKLEPVLLEQGALQRPYGVKRPGRPRIVASWFPEVAKTMADGNTLMEALKKHGITLDKPQIRALYRNEEFKRLVREARDHKRRADKLQSSFSGGVDSPVR
jgi:hypothetical protein